MKKHPVDAKIWKQGGENWFQERGGVLRGASFEHSKNSSLDRRNDSQSFGRRNGEYFIGFRIVRNKDRKE